MEGNEMNTENMLITDMIAEMMGLAFAPVPKQEEPATQVEQELYPFAQEAELTGCCPICGCDHWGLEDVE
jgi:hypothetical protein